MSCEPRVYENVTVEQFVKLADRARDHGILLQGNSGFLDVHHCQMVWSYEGERVIIQCLKKPFFVGCEQINTALDELLKV